MYAAEHHYGPAIIDRLDDPCREIQAEIRIPASDLYRQVEGWPLIDIADLGKTLRTQQLLGDVLRGDADAGILQDAHGGGFRCSLSDAHARHAGEPGRCGQ